MILLKDGVRYFHHEYKKEAELERMAIEHYRMMFGEYSIHFPKRRIQSLSGVGGIPDGFVIGLDEKKWWVLEFELSEHSLYKHVIPQISRFRKAYQGSRSKLIKAFYDDAKEDPQKRVLFEIRGIGEIHKTLSDIVESTPTITVIMDEKTSEAEEAIENLPFETRILEFKTYFREEVGMGSHIHVFEAIHRAPPPEPQIDKKGKGKAIETAEVPAQVARRLKEKDWPQHYYRIAKAMVKPGTLPFLIRNTIRERKDLKMKELRGAVKKGGYAPFGGQVHATVVFLERVAGEVLREGRGEVMRIKWKRAT